jgi:hypothetical protein
MVQVLRTARLKHSHSSKSTAPEISRVSLCCLPPLAPDAHLKRFRNHRCRAPEGCRRDRDQNAPDFTTSPVRRNPTKSWLPWMRMMTWRCVKNSATYSYKLCSMLRLPTSTVNSAWWMCYRGIHAKLIRRHPHVFGDLKIRDKEGVIENWERLKARETGVWGSTC